MISIIILNNNKNTPLFLVVKFINFSGIMISIIPIAAINNDKTIFALLDIEKNQNENTNQNNVTKDL